ncbi:helix-turn-helix domain-containing protein [Amycolatopsis sp. NPDC004747]
MDDCTTPGTRVKYYRRKRKLSQRELDERADPSIDVVRKPEQGTRLTAGITSLQKLACALDVTIAELLHKVTQVGDVAADSGVS